MILLFWTSNESSQTILLLLLLLSSLEMCQPGITYGRQTEEGGVELPHCTRNMIMSDYEEMSNRRRTKQESNQEDQQLNVTSHSEFVMSLRETTCLTLEFNQTYGQNLPIRVSYLHTIEYLRLEHNYAITGKYKFAIPLISQQCKCDCAGGDAISNTGCITSAKSELCCQIQIDPYKDWSFQAVRLKQPDTMLILRYRIYQRLNGEKRWKQQADQHITLPLNRGVAKFVLNNDHSIQIIAHSTRPNRQVEPGMYFWQIGADGQQLREVGMAEVGGWQVECAQGTVKLTQAQHVNVQDCKAQKYTSTFNAEQFVLRSDDEDIVNYELGSTLLEDAWVAAIDVDSNNRFIKIEHAEGAQLTLGITTESRPNIIHHTSQFTGFTGAIQLDSESNRYLNLTLQNARGSFVVEVYAKDYKAVMDLVFSIQVGDQSRAEFRTIAPVDATIQDKRLVCIFPAGDYNGQICNWLEYLAEPLREFKVAHRWWQQGHAECIGCNERGVDSVLAAVSYLCQILIDPRNWLDGLNSPTEFFTCVIEILLCISALLLGIAIFTKCIIPLFRCVSSISSPPKKK
uniref:Uncharacterized protein n=1 Tax=Ditylenchus dipsaci TaxID=166011 RepID=A0A915DTV8_9BILA